ncbi:TIGR04283 family arsenosugar biosynthesis glycosyltransferase [Rufibacter sp. LB8]|uniref:TIGR04283 family arsenosugar biosynthesis glycosyltransferase n=1 Tax=Rufibacter sp. LB8 TaxID=2777781 RepID=UPI00178C78B1|nr:TIGR04283 family arsenosugar biosynthesis glycosyltransferase [Rufibacter sp. LB8]
MKISIVIPTLNEEALIGPLVRHLLTVSAGLVQEVIVADGGSQDQTVTMAQQAGARIVRCAGASRAKQMNAGARAAHHDILHFIHADSWPPAGYAAEVVNAVKAGYKCGCFRSKFLTTNRFLLLNSYFTRFKGLVFRGGGQTLFVEKQLFWQVQGYDERLLLMEEYDLIKRLSGQGRFTVLPQTVLVSARKYAQVGNVKLQMAYGLVMLFYFLGAPQQKLQQIYKRFIS